MIGKCGEPTRVPLLQTLWMFLGLAVLIEAMTLCTDFEIFGLFSPENKVKRPALRNHIVNTVQMASRPNTVFLEQSSDGSAFVARQGRSVEPIWAGDNWEENHKYPDPTAGVFRNSFPIDGEGKKEDCIPAADWQTKFYTTCNSFHELDFRPIHEANEKPFNESGVELGGFATDMLGIGTSIFAWQVANGGDPVVLKTLKMECPPGCEFSHKNYGKQRVDAIASERLTSSPYVLDVYGFCGMSVMNELGKMYDKSQELSVMDKLRYSRDIAAGMADMHGLDGGVPHPMLTHGDFKQGNVIFSYDGSTLKLSDFNKGHLLETNKKTGEACGYFKPPSKFGLDILAPEEVYGTVRSHMTDAYHLGGMIFFLLTNHKTYYLDGKDVVARRKEKLDETGEWMFPTFPEDMRNTKDPAIITMKKAVRSTFRLRPEDRASAKEVFLMLNSTLTKLES